MSPVQLTDVRGGREEWGGVKSYDGEKAWPSFKTILFVYGTSRLHKYHTDTDTCFRPVASTTVEAYKIKSEAVFRIQIRVRIRIYRIHMFFDLPDPDPLVRGMDPDSDPSIIMQK